MTLSSFLTYYQETSTMVSTGQVLLHHKKHMMLQLEISSHILIRWQMALIMKWHIQPRVCSLPENHRENWCMQSQMSWHELLWEKEFSLCSQGSFAFSENMNQYYGLQLNIKQMRWRKKGKMFTIQSFFYLSCECPSFVCKYILFRLKKIFQIFHTQ